MRKMGTALMMEPGLFVQADVAETSSMKQLPFRPERSYCFPNGAMSSFLWETQMSDKNEVWQGTLALMVLKTLDVMGTQHGYGIARRIEQISDNLLAVNHGTLYPVLLKLEQEGAIKSDWGVSENKRKARFYKITRTGRKQLEAEARSWQTATEIIARFFAPRQEAE